MLIRKLRSRGFDAEQSVAAAEYLAKNECLNEAEDAAREAFDALAYESAILFRLGQRRNGEFALRDVSIVGKISAAELDSPVDTYVTAPDFAWTYVHTHEDCCGPYFCRRKVPSSFPTR